MNPDVTRFASVERGNHIAVQQVMRATKRIHRSHFVIDPHGIEISPVQPQPMTGMCPLNGSPQTGIVNGMSKCSTLAVNF